MPPSASSSGAPSNSSGNGRMVSSSTVMETSGTATSIAVAASASDTAGPPRWNTRAPSRAARAAAIEAAVPGVSITVDEETILPFPEEFDGAPLDEALGGVSWTPLEAGVSATVDRLRAVPA